MSYRSSTRRKALRPEPGQLSLFDEPEPPAPPPAAPEAPARQASPFPAAAPHRTPSQRAEANVKALTLLRALQAAARPAGPAERESLAAWTGWGAIPEVFDPAAAGWAAAARGELAWLLDDAGRAAAARSTLNAHYTDPQVAAAMWEAATQLGFTGGEAFEPGCGPGLLIATAPATAHMTGVELDPATAAIAALISPDADIRAESLAAVNLPAGYFDLAIGNVPFGDYQMPEADPVVPGAGRHAIHNHAIIKALHLLRPGGILLTLTSRYTLDAASQAARADMAAVADLIGAVRLPEGSHQESAGTKTVMDLLILRRRELGQPGQSGLPWLAAETLDVAGHGFTVSTVFHPGGGGHVLGTLAAGTTAHGPALTVTPGPGDLPAELAAALAAIAADAHAAGLAWTPAAQARPALPAPVSLAGQEGRITARIGGTFTRHADGQDVPFRVPAAQAPELAALCDLRDTAEAVIATEAATGSDLAELDQLRSRLNDLYDRYAAAYGPLNRFTPTPTGRVDPLTFEPVMAARRPRQGGFHGTGSALPDPGAALVYALEIFDPATQAAAKAGIFTRRTVARRTHPDQAGTPEDAVAISLDRHGRVDLAHVAALLGVSQAGAREQLGTLVYADPDQGGALVTAAAYLSGNVRDKLRSALAAAITDPAYEGNVTALTAVIPADLTPADIGVTLGAPWIPAGDVQDFLQHILEDPRLSVTHPGGSYWEVTPLYSNGGVLATSKWGTGRRPAYDLAEKLLEQRVVQVHDTVPAANGGERRVLNPEETAAAQAKAQQIADRFADWVWEDPERAARLARTYNDMFNNLVLRSYDGVTLTLPGLAAGFDPHPHQHAGVARMIAEPTALLAHEVGAGKTATMVMGVMEMRRLGLAGTACVVVPNHMLEQFAREWVQLYPQAKIIATTSEDLTAYKRLQLRARLLTGEWDAIITTQSAFEKIPVSLDLYEAYKRDEINYLAQLITRAAGATVKRLERLKARAMRRLADHLNHAVDPGVTFEQLGIGYLVVDEAHHFKNLATPSAISDAAIAGSKMASDLHMKLWYLRGQGPRCLTMATATPIANSITEAYVMCRYLRPDLLAAAGISEFDVWAAVHGLVVAAVELAPEGGGTFRVNTRFARFRNVPELSAMFRMFADVKLAADLTLDIPLMARRPGDGKRAHHIIAVPPTAAQQGYIADLGECARLIRAGTPRQFGTGATDPLSGEEITKDDNMLWVSTRGRLAATDGRLTGLLQDTPGKLHAIGTVAAGVYRRHPGRLQIVFCDQGTPKAGRDWDAYGEMTAAMVAGGIPRNRIAYAHDARNERQRAAMFAACRAGRTAVIIGSTGKLGTGVNIQDRLAAIHQADPTWRPADIKQRLGRAFRQGNTCPEVESYVYVTEGSFDGFMWQTLTRKENFINQFMTGNTGREMSDLGDDGLTYHQIMALTTGNPLILDAAEAEADVQRLERAERAHRHAQEALRFTIRHNQAAIGWERDQVARDAAILDRRQDTAGDAFQMTVAGTRHGTPAAAAEALAVFLLAQVRDLAYQMQARGHALTREDVTAGWYAGFPVLADLTGTAALKEARVTLHLGGVRPRSMGFRSAALAWDADQGGMDKTSMIAALEYDLNQVARDITDREQRIAAALAETARAEAELGAPFAGAAALAAARARAARIEADMAALAKAPAAPETAVAA